MENGNENAKRFINLSIHNFKWIGFDFKRIYRWRECLLVAILCELNISAICQAVNIVLSEFDLQKTTEAIIYLNYYLVSLGKLETLVYNRGELHAMVTELHRLYPSAQVEKDYKLRKYLRWYMRMERILSWFFHSTAFLHNWVQVIPIFVSLWRGNGFIYKTPLNFWNPIKIPHTWYVLLFVYPLQVHASYMSAMTILATDLCLFGSVMQLCMHYDIISQNILHIEPNETTEAETRLKEQIVYHQSVLKLTDKINSIFTPSILFSLLSSSLILCFTGYQLLGDVTIGTVVQLVILLAYEFKQVTITCFLCDRLMDIGVNLSDAIYEHKWYNGTPKYKRLVLIALIRSQQTVSLNIAGITDISKQTLRQVLSISYKVFAVLKT